MGLGVCYLCVMCIGYLHKTSLLKEDFLFWDDVTRTNQIHENESIVPENVIFELERIFYRVYNMSLEGRYRVLNYLC